MDRFNELLARWRVYYGSLPPQRRFSLILSLVTSLVLTAGVVASWVRGVSIVTAPVS